VSFDRANLRATKRADLRAAGVTSSAMRAYASSEILRFLRTLRTLESVDAERHRRPSAWLRWAWCRLRLHRLGRALGFEIPPHVFGPGLAIPHRGPIIVNAAVRVGHSCRLHSSVTIGDFHGSPRLGNNVYIGPGARIFGPIVIGDDVRIGANAVVREDVPSGVTVAGVPARIVSPRENRQRNLAMESGLGGPASLGG
jgi:serine O-acetyltransferase